MNITNHIAFVDPFSSVRFLAEHLRASGIQTSVIYTGYRINSNYFNFQPELFDQAFFLEDFKDREALVTALRDAKIQRIYSGGELAVEITDELANVISPEFANPSSSSLARCDKYEMQEALRKANVPCVKQIKIKNTFEPQELNELLHWQFPVIIKPINGFATMGVKVCNNLDEIRNFLQASTQIDLYPIQVTDFVIQELLIGKEYFVDTFSENGKHYVSGVQRYERILHEQIPVCLYSEIVPLDTEEAQQCIDYVLQTLSAVELNNGFAHTEIMLTEKGPYLIEVNPRVSGAAGCNHKLFHHCNYPTQIDFLIDSCKKQTTAWTEEKKYGRKVYLHNFKERAIQELNIKQLETLPSYRESLMIKSPGTIVGAPQNLTDVVGFVLLSHEDSKQIETDTAKIQEWEKELALF